MSIQVFISYKSEYRDFAREVKNRIDSWGYKSWLDVDEIPDGSYFRFEIDKGLKTSDVVVGVITQEAQESREVLFELDFAIKKNKPLLPLKYRDCELMYHLESIQWIDFTKDSEAGFERLHKRLTQLADSLTKPETAPPAESQENDLLAKFIEDNDKAHNGASLPPSLSAQIMAALGALSERERIVLEMRFGLADGQEHSRNEVAQHMGVANERIRQLETRALRNVVQNQRSQPASETPAEAALTHDGTVIPGSFGIGGLVEDAIPKPNVSSPIVQPSAPVLPPMQASAARRGGGIFSTLAGILMLPFAGIAALVSWLRSSGRDEADLARTNRAAMLSKVQEFWVVGVLENALKESGAFDLGLSSAPGAVLKHIDYGDYALPTSANIGDVFNDLNRELLILGAPGAGKTIMLLQLAQDLIQRAQADPNLAMPAVFNLSSWAAERKPLEAWLVDELRLKYQVPKKVAQTWVETEQLTLLLDGLDEVAEDYRNACVEAINAYRQKYAKTDIAVCSRIADYDVLTSKLDLRGAITLQPLSMEQVNHYIDRPELAVLRETLKTDATLQGMAGTPFLLNTMAYAYRDATSTSLHIPDSTDPAKSRRNHLFDAYVKKRLGSSAAQYTAAQTRHYLAWLAEKMQKLGQIVFYVEALQPDYLSSKGQIMLYHFGNRLLAGIFIGLSWGLILQSYAYGMGIQLGLLASLAIGGFAGLAGGTAWGIITGLLFIRHDEITLVEALNWSWKKGVSGFTATLLWAMTSWLMVQIFQGNAAIIASLVWSLVAAIITYYFFLQIWKIGIWVVGIALTIGFISFIVSAAHDIRITLFVGLLVGVLIALEFGLKGATVTVRMRPNQGIWRSLQIGVLVGIMLGLVAGFIASVFQLGNVQSVGVVVGLSAGFLSFGGSAIIRHLTLRLILYRSDQIPLNYARFLDYCASIQILRKVGGGYIFVHRYLLEYFASEQEGMSP